MKTVLVLLCLLATAGGQDKQYPIMELDATGSERYSEGEVLRATGLVVDPQKEIPLSLVRQAAERLVASGVFAEVRFLHTEVKGGMRVAFTLADKTEDQFRPAIMENMVWLGEQAAIDAVYERVPLFDGELPTIGGLGDEVAAALQKLLNSRGVPGHVGYKEKKDSTGEIEAFSFSVDDVLIKIASVDVPGAGEPLAGEVTRVANELQGREYSRSGVEAFIQRELRPVFLKHGKLRVTIAPPTPLVTSIQPGETLVNVSIPVEEGLAYRFSSAKWRGNTVVETGILDQSLGLEPGQVVDGTQLAKDLTSIRAEYARLGYMQMTLDSAPDFDDANARVSFKLSLHEGSLFTMGKLAVEGTSKELSRKIYAAWNLREGDPFDLMYVHKFLSTPGLFPESQQFVIEQSQGELPQSVDVTLLVCRPGMTCKSSLPDHLFQPGKD